jgi:hypothetical protein
MVFMMIRFCFTLVNFLLFLLLQANTLLAVSQAETLPLQAENFEHIQFRMIKANRHTYHNQQLKIEVDDSASLLMKPFDDVKQVTKVSFE